MAEVVPVRALSPEEEGQARFKNDIQYLWHLLCDILWVRTQKAAEKCSSSIDLDKYIKSQASTLLLLSAIDYNNAGVSKEKFIENAGTMWEVINGNEY